MVEEVEDAASLRLVANIYGVDRRPGIVPLCTFGYGLVRVFPAVVCGP